MNSSWTSLGCTKKNPIGYALGNGEISRWEEMEKEIGYPGGGAQEVGTETQSESGRCRMLGSIHASFCLVKSCCFVSRCYCCYCCSSCDSSSHLYSSRCKWMCVSEVCVCWSAQMCAHVVHIQTLIPFNSCQPVLSDQQGCSSIHEDTCCLNHLVGW